jgi:hypothetical protein
MVVVVVFVVVVVVVVAVGVGSEMDGEWAKESRELGWRSESTSSRQVVEKKKKTTRRKRTRDSPLAQRQRQAATATGPRGVVGRRSRVMQETEGSDGQVVQARRHLVNPAHAPAERSRPGEAVGSEAV